MKCHRFLIAGLFVFGCMSAADGQFVVGPRIGFSRAGVSIYRPPVIVHGFAPHVHPIGGFVPATPFPPFGMVERRLTVQVVTPPVIVVRPRVYVEPAPEYDVTGVDLDIMRLPTAAELAAGKPLKAERIPPRMELPKKKPAPAPPKQRPPKKPVPPKKEPKQTESDVIQLGLEAFHNKQYGLAAARFRHATNMGRFGHRSHFLLAQAWFALGEYEKAVRAIEAGMDRRPDWPTKKFAPRDELYKGIEPEFDADIERLEKVVAQHPKNADFLFLLAYQYWFDGRKAEAAGLFRRARALTMNLLYIDKFLQAAPPGQVAAAE